MKSSDNSVDAIMALKELQQRIPGYLALGLLVTLTTFWTYWGVGEAYYEGWWGAWYNPVIYLIPAAVLLALTIVGIRWPRKGGLTIVIAGVGIFVWWLAMSEFSALNILKAFLLGGLAASAFGELDTTEKVVSSQFALSTRYRIAPIGYCRLLNPLGTHCPRSCR